MAYTNVKLISLKRLDSLNLTFASWNLLLVVRDRFEPWERTSQTRGRRNDDAACSQPAP